jgi:DNA modification methylase
VGEDAVRLGPYLLGANDTPENGIYTGDARELASAIPDESVDLIFTDPVYQNIDDYRWLAETAARVLKPDSACLVHHGTGFLPETLDALKTGGLIYQWQAVCYMPGMTMNYINCKMFNNWRSLLVMGKGTPRATGPVRDHIYDGNPAYLPAEHRWEKGSIPTIHYISGFSSDNMIVVDFFCGGGTVPAVCKQLGRRYLAFEINPVTAQAARDRVRQAQPPLPGLVTEQMEMTL